MSVNVNEKNCENLNSKILKDDGIFENLYPEFKTNLPMESFDFEPKQPTKLYSFFCVSKQHLAKRIYLEMLRAITNYGQLISVANEQDKNTIENLKNQMEILSLAMLNLYGKMFSNSAVPFLTMHRTKLSKDYLTALKQMYNRVYHIHNLVFKLLSKTDEQYRSTLIIIFTNLKSQLKNLDNLIIKNQ